MGYFAHDAVIAYVWGDDSGPMVDGFRAGMPEELRHLLVGPIPVVVNGGDSYFMFAPDGSKEGWDTSNEAEEWRVRFIDLLRPISADIVAVRFGGDYGVENGASIVFSQPERL